MWGTYGHHTYQRTGIVREVVLPNTNPPIDKYAETHNLKSFGGGHQRACVSFLVEVPAQSRKAKPFLYWPRTKSLELVGQPPEEEE